MICFKNDTSHVVFQTVKGNRPTVAVENVDQENLHETDGSTKITG